MEVVTVRGLRLLMISAVLGAIVICNVPMVTGEGDDRRRKLVVDQVTMIDRKLPGEERHLLEGVLCAKAAEYGRCDVVCVGDVEDASDYNDFTCKSTGDSCQEERGSRLIRERYNPDLILRTAFDRIGGGYLVTMKLYSADGRRVIDTISRTVPTSDGNFVDGLGGMVAGLLEKSAGSMEGRDGGQ